MSERPIEISSEAPVVGTATARPGGPSALEASYLAKDYASFRRLILDRLAQRIPAWQERHIPDVGIMLVELMAYLGDQLSYYQDAVATEAYLGTARRRVSLRRHARLVDYPMHEGCNARAWVCISVSEDCAIDLDDVGFATRPPGAGNRVAEADLPDAAPGSYEFFEPVVAERGEGFGEADLRDPVETLSRLGPALNRDAPTPYDGPEALHYTLLADMLNAKQRALLREVVEGRARVGRSLGAGFDVKAVRTEQSTLNDQLPRIAGTIVEGLNRLLNLPLPASGPLAAAEPPPAAAWLLRGAALRRYQRQRSERAYQDDLLQGRQRMLHKAHNRIELSGPLLPQGAALIDTIVDPASARRALQLTPGDVLVFEQPVRDPRRPGAEQSDPLRCHVVRLTAVAQGFADDGTPLLSVTWGPEDALPGQFDGRVGFVARGNVLLVDHGRTRRDLPLTWSSPLPGHSPALSIAEGPVVFSQPLAEPPVGQAPPSAAALMRQDAGRATAAISLSSAADPWRNRDTVSLVRDAWGREEWRHVWTPRRDLLASDPRDLHFVPEADDAGVVWLRFSDAETGVRPDEDRDFRATVRLGGGPAGNVGAGAIDTLVFRRYFAGYWKIITVRNPLPALGGRAPESADQVRAFAPDYFRTRLERAVTAEDYAAIVMRDFAAEVQKAAATLRWTGARYEVLVVVDPYVRGRAANERETFERMLCERVVRHLEDYRRMGHDLVVELARQVPVALTLKVQVQRAAWRGQVRADLLARFGTEANGYFNPDRRSFGEGIALSEIYALAQAAPGVESVTIALRRERGDPGDAQVSGLLQLGPLEVAAAGRLVVQIEGGGR